MKQIFSENTIIENLIVCYFIQEETHILTGKVEKAIDEFLKFYKMWDDINDTNNLEIIKKIYSINSYEERDEFLQSINMSETALFRFRKKIVDELSKHIHNIKK